MTKKRIQSRMLYNYLHDPSAIAGSVILVIAVSAALLAPWITPQDPYNLAEVSLEYFLTPPLWMEEGQAPFILGTDDQGRCIFSTIIYGCRTSLIVGFSVVLFTGTFGVLMGLLTGFYGGKLDAFIMRVADTIYAFSTTLLALMFLGIFGKGSVLLVILAICIAGWVRYARTMRGSVLEIKQEAYIMAAKATGAGDFRLLMRHLLPNAIPPIFVIVAVDLAVVIMIEATLSFLGASMQGCGG
jgi:peptide/nickel transport system permease protein